MVFGWGLFSGALDEGAEEEFGDERHAADCFFGAAHD